MGSCCVIGPNVGDKNQTINGMLWEKNVIISQEKARGRGSTEKEGCTAFIGEERQTGTASNQTDRNPIGGLQNVAPRILDGQTGTSYNQTQKNLIEQAVKSNGGGNRAGK